MRILALIFFICAAKSSYAQSIGIDTNGIYIGAYSLDFNGSQEAK